VVGDGSESWKSFNPTDGVEVFGPGSSSDSIGVVVIKGVLLAADGALGSTVGGAASLMEISSIAPSLSMQKLNSPKAMSKPPVLAEVGPVEPGTDPLMAAAVRLMSSPKVAIGLTLLTLMVGEVLPMMVSVVDGETSMAVLMTVSMAVSMMVSMTVSMAVVGEGAGESVDPDPIVPTVGTN
jgi:hypothetical protein